MALLEAFLLKARASDSASEAFVLKARAGVSASEAFVLKRELVSLLLKHLY